MLLGRSGESVLPAQFLPAQLLAAQLFIEIVSAGETVRSQDLTWRNRCATMESPVGSFDCVGLTGRYCRYLYALRKVTSVQLTITAAIHARWGHRVDHLIHTHAWEVEATVEGDIDADKVFPADDLESILREMVEPWIGRYLTNEDVGDWKGYTALVWEREATVEEIARQLWAQLDGRVPGLVEVALKESTEFDRNRTVRLSRQRSLV